MARPSPAPVLLLPPSEGKAPGGSMPPWTPGTMRVEALDGCRAEVLDALAEGAALRAEPTLPAIDRYTGVLYKALAYRDLPAGLRRRVDAQVLVFSGLWGLVAPRDPIPAYSCKMSRRVPPLGTLATWWRPRLAPVLDGLVDRRVVWDLLPNEHRAAWPASDAPRRRITVRFLDDVERGGRRELVTVSHWNKLLKGALVRHVVETQLTDVEGLARFEHPEGYRYRPDLTEDHGAGRLTVALVARR